jgi:hypothetical protein
MLYGNAQRKAMAPEYSPSPTAGKRTYHSPFVSAT